MHPGFARVVMRIAFAAAMLWAGEATAAEPLVLSTGMREPWTNAQFNGFHNQVIAALFVRVGLQAKVVFNAASARALQMADDGTDDGLVGRIAGLEDTLPNLVRVPEPLFYNDFIAAGAPSAPAVAHWSDLSQHMVAYILGWQIFDRFVPETRQLTIARDANQLFSLLAAGRAQVILCERMQALWLARERNIPIKIHEPPLARVPMFIYLHRRHADLVPQVTAALTAMKADGEYGVIWARAFGELGKAR